MPNQIRGTSQIIADTIPFTIYKSAPVILTDAQIKALPSSPYPEILPALPEGQSYIVIVAMLTFDKSGGAYTNVSAESSLQLVYGDWDDDATQETSPSLSSTFENTQVTSYRLVPRSKVDEGQYTTGHTSLFLSSEIRLTCNNVDGNLTGGDAANTLKVTVYYGIIEP